MSIYLYWREKKTGDIYAVRLTNEGQLIGATGPLLSSEASIGTDTTSGQPTAGGLDNAEK